MRAFHVARDYHYGIEFVATAIVELARIAFGGLFHEFEAKGIVVFDGRCIFVGFIDERHGLNVAFIEFLEENGHAAEKHYQYRGEQGHHDKRLFCHCFEVFAAYD